MTLGAGGANSVTAVIGGYNYTFNFLTVPNVPTTIGAITEVNHGTW
jgi:hypothetical protein